jgi:RNA polymerase-associated protein LEO1
VRAQIESNTKIVKWSDGTYSLAIGDEFFDMNIENLSQRQLFASHEDISLYKGSILKRMIVKPPQTQR